MIMATNRRRNTRSSSLRTNTVKVYPTDGATPAGVAATEATTSGATTTETIDWRTEYAYVHKDLRQLGVVSAILFGLLLLVGLLL
jgi:hypothetical protein